MSLFLRVLGSRDATLVTAPTTPARGFVVGAIAGRGRHPAPATLVRRAARALLNVAGLEAAVRSGVAMLIGSSFLL
jgi:siroheme synthase (precorrin-2 oxidase/ferrochelatase)